MKKTISVFLILMISVLSYGQEKQPFTIYDYFKLKTLEDIAVSPDGKYTAFTLNINRPMDQGKGNDFRELYIKNLETNEIKPLITGQNYLISLAWTPDGKTVTFRAKFNDVKNYQVFGYDIDGDTYRQITNVDSGIRSYAWNPNGKGLAYTSEIPGKKRDTELTDMGFDAEVYEENLSVINLYYQENNTIEKLNSHGSVFDFSWSPDGNIIAAQIADHNLVDYSYMFKEIYLIDVSDKTMELWIDPPGKLSQMAWSPDGEHIAFIAGVDISDPVDGSLFSARTDEPVGWEKVKNYSEGFEGSVTHVEWIDEKTMLYSSQESVSTTLSTIGVKDRKRSLLTEDPEIVYSSFEIVDEKVYMLANAKDHPDELFSYDLDNRKFKRETISNPWLDELKMGKQEKISYEARDGLRVEGVLTYPIDFKEGEKYPMICYIHGGPESAVLNGWTTSYSRWGQIAAGQGYFVFMPNYRASSGRGVEFSKMDQRDLGDEEFLDVIDGIEYIADKGYIDKKKVGIGGGSYGGYFSALGATKYTEHFAAAVPFVGVTNQLSKVNLTDIPYEIYHVHWTIWPNEDPQLYYDRSPVKYSDQSKTPTLLLHGKEDTRVHPSQSLELYRQLKLHGEAPVRLIWYPGEGHGNRNNQAQLDFNLRTMRWYNHYLKGEGDPKELPPTEINYQLEKLSDMDLDTGS